MYKLCIALAFLAVAAAKPSWPLYSGLDELAYPYHAGYPYNYNYGYNYGYNAPLVKSAVVASAPVVAAPVVKAYPEVAAPVVAAPLVKAYPAEVAPLSYSAPLAPVAPLAHIDPYYHGYAAEPLISYGAGFPIIAKKK